MKKPAVGIGGLEMAGNDGWKAAPQTSHLPVRRVHVAVIGPNQAPARGGASMRGYLRRGTVPFGQYKGWAIENLPDG
jgi:hypothetical protein